MEEGIKGKYSHTKIKFKTITSKGSPEEVKRFCDVPVNEYRSYDNCILGATERAIAILQKSGLPVSPQYKLTANDKEWTGYLSAYVIDKLGYEHDSLEGLAARILTNIEQFKTAEERNLKQDAILFLAMEFGELTTDLRRNSATLREKSNNKSEGKKKPWADIAKRLIDDNPNTMFKDCWGLFPNDDEGELYNCYREDDFLHYNKYGENELIIKKSSFRRTYQSLKKYKK